jgi:quercetin dioxygenase-like cupin family protein
VDLQQRAILDEVELRIVQKLGGKVQHVGEQLPDFPLTHRFTEGMYVREIFMPAGAIVTSKIHKTQHPFAVLRGRVKVWVENDEWQTLEAGHLGITEAGTRRLLLVLEDTVWVTFHATELRDVEAIEHAILEPHTNPLLLDYYRVGQIEAGGAECLS